MKIKELHIRNIASIEKADIDFEKDLNETFTNTPAPIFLITGNTGAGKSIILDAIAMALYKITPRLSSVNNTINNSFINSTGESISVKSIEQYTRMGISPKDDCYSELLFEGNDGKTYKARLTLGMSNMKGQSKAVEKCFKYNKPKWSLDVGGVSYTAVNDIKQKIQESVGLTFAQFSRMAMLAQGQFAAFLTGDKIERETILEKLTNTQHFSFYGTAIENLFKKAKAIKISAQQLYDLEKEHTLPENEVIELKKLQQETMQHKTELEKSLDGIGKQIEQLNIIEGGHKNIKDANDALTKLEAIVNGEEYKGKKALKDDWENTVTERQRLDDLLKANDKLKGLKDIVIMLQSTYNTLAADLVDKERQLSLLNAEIEKDNQWLDARIAQDELYSNAKAFLVQLDQYKSQIDDIKKLTDKKKAAEEKVEVLKNALSIANEQLTKSKQAVDDKQKVIDDKTKERETLKPSEITSKLDTLGKEKAKLEQLQTDINHYNNKIQNYNNLLAEITDDKKKLETLQETLTQKEQALKTAEETYEQANARFVTMGSSIEDTMVALRQRLIIEHAETCPLCGQGITHELLSTDDFQIMITPLEEEKNRCKKAMDEAKHERDDAKDKFNKLKGSIDTKNKQATDQHEENKKERQRIEGVASTIHLDPKNRLPLQIAERLEKNEKETQALTQSSNKAEALQKEINGLLEEKKLLEIAQSNADKAKQKVEKDFDANEKEIKDCSEKIEEAESKKSTLTSQLSTLLQPVYPDWAKDTEGTKTQLKAAAKEYTDKKTQRDTNVTQAKTDKILLESICGIKKNILDKIPNWDKTFDAVPHTSNDITKEWNDLLASVSDYISNKKSQEKTINDCSTELEAYYLQSGKDEAYLKSIGARKDELETAKAFVKKTDDDITSQQTTIKNAQKMIQDALIVLKVEKEEELTDKNTLEAKKQEQTGEMSALMERLGNIKGKLEQNDENNSKLADAQKHLDQADQTFQKWEVLNSYFGGTRFRTLVQTYVLRPLLNNANIYLQQITDRYNLTCSEDNEQLSILVFDNYSKQMRSSTLLSGGERFMISLALSLALSSLNRPDLNVNILFIDEGFGTLDETSIESVMSTLEKLQDIAGMKDRRVGIISHRKELDRIPVQIQVKKKGEGRSEVSIIKS